MKKEYKTPVCNIVGVAFESHLLVPSKYNISGDGGTNGNIDIKDGNGDEEPTGAKSFGLSESDWLD